MSGNMQRWISNDALLATDSASQYSLALSDVSVDDRIRSPDIGQRLSCLFKEQLYTDVKFVINCGIKPKPSLHAHKAILAIGSEKFREILFGNNDPPGAAEFQINNVPFDAFRNVVEYLYTDDVIFENDQSVLEILSTARQFKVEPLINKCESYIESVELTEENVCTKFYLSTNHKLESLKARCVEFIQENTGPVLRSADFLAANTSTVRSICKLEKFNLRSEIEILQGIVRWVKERCDSPTNMRTLVEPFFKHIRLLNISGEDFNQFVQKHKNLFTAPEVASILFSLASAGNLSPNLPTWCKRGSNRCTFHLLASPQARQTDRGMSNAMKNLSIFLKPTNLQSYLSSMICVLELTCNWGKHQVEGLKLSFDDPVDDTSIISQLTITVDISPSQYHNDEILKIENSKDVEVMFTRKLLMRRGDVLSIKAEAQHVKNYKFLQFDERGSISGDSPFKCNLGSLSKQNRLFFISEVFYRNNTSTPSKRGGLVNRRRRLNPRGPTKVSDNW